MTVRFVLYYIPIPFSHQPTKTHYQKKTTLCNTQYPSQHLPVEERRYVCVRYQYVPNAVNMDDREKETSLRI